MTLPSSKQNQKTNKQFISLSVNEEKQYFIDKQQVSFEDLEEALIARVGNDKEQTIVVRIPYNLQVQDLVDLMQIGVKRNLKMQIATNKK